MPWLYLLLALIIAGTLVWIVNTTPRPIPGSIKSIVNVVLGLIVVGIVLWVINNYVPMAASIKAILNIVVFVATCVWVLRAVGLWSPVVRVWNNVTSHIMSH